MISFPLRKTSVPAREYPRSPSYHPATTGRFRTEPVSLPSVAFLVPDGIEPANTELQQAYIAPRLELPANGYPEELQPLLQAKRYTALRPSMVPSKSEMATAAWVAAREYNLESIDGDMTANPPQFIPLLPAALTVDRPKTFMILGEPITVHLPLTEPVNPGPWFAAWDNGKRPIYSPPLPQPASEFTHGPVEHPETEEERQVFAFLAGPWFGVERTITRRKPDRLARLMARFWEHGDGKSGLQPVDARNAELRSMAA